MWFIIFFFWEEVGGPEKGLLVVSSMLSSSLLECSEGDLECSEGSVSALPQLYPPSVHVLSVCPIPAASTRLPSSLVPFCQEC